MRLTFRKHFNSLIPDEATDPYAVEWLRGLKHGTFLTIEKPKRARNLDHHRKFFAMLNLIADNQEHYSREELLDACKIAVGHTKTIHMLMGDFLIPQSINFASMDQDAFNKFYEAAVQWVLTEVIPGLERRDLDEQVASELREFAA